MKTEPFLTPYVSGHKILIQFPSSSVTDLNDLQSFYDYVKDIPNCNLLDVGANKGYYALLATVKPDLFFYSFEPNRRIYKRFLLGNLVLNKVENRGKTFDYGLSKSRCTTELWYDNSLKATMIRDEAKEREIQEILKKSPKRASHVRYTSVMCDFHTLDSVADEVFNGKEVQAVKVDVEGAEQWVVEGGAKFFEKTNALLFIEAISVNFERFGTTVAKLLDLLKGFGYKTFKRYGYNYMCLK